MSEREEFLAEPHIGALSVSAGPDRGPLTVPVWYQYAPGGELWVLTGADSRKAKLIKEAGRFTVMEQLLEMTSRYLPEERVGPYLEFAKANLPDDVAIYMSPQRWLSADLGES